MDPTVVLFKAIQRLRPDAKFSCHEGVVKEWHDKTITMPSQEEIEAEKKKVIDEYEANEYQRQRAVEYPPFADQFDLLYHGGYDAWKAEIDKIKNKYPK